MTAGTAMVRTARGTVMVRKISSLVSCFLAILTEQNLSQSEYGRGIEKVIDLFSKYDKVIFNKYQAFFAIFHDQET